MHLANTNDGDEAVFRGVDVVGRFGQAAMAVAGARRGLALAAKVHAQVGGQRGVHRLLHRHLDQSAQARALALKQRGHDAAIQMDAAKKITQGRTGLDRRPVRETGDVHDAGHGLHREVHGRVVFVGAAAAIARSCAVHDARVDRAHLLVAHAQALHRTGGEVLHHHITSAHHLEQQLATARGFEVEGDEVFVRVEHGKRHRRTTYHAAPAQMLATGRLDFDDTGTGHGQQKAAIRAVVNLTQIDHGDAIQRQRAAHLNAP